MVSGMKQFGWFGAALMALLYCGHVSPVEASVVLQLTDQQMTLRADRIVRAKVIRKVSQWMPKQRRIYTFITLLVMDPVKGAKSSQEVVIRQLGGTANGMGMYIPGSANFQLGEEVFVFLEKIKKSVYHHVMSMSYGKFTVIKQPKTHTYKLVRQLKGVSLATRSKTTGRLQIKHGHDVQAKTLTLGAYVKKIRGYLQAAKAAPSVRVVTPRPVKRVVPSLKTPPTTR